MEASILLVEDTLSDAELIREAFLDSKIQHKIDLVTDGEEALRVLKGLKEMPHLILLDLNLPKKSGLEGLREIRRDPNPFLCVVPIIILTNSKSKEDVLKAYTNGCNAYIRKPIGFENLVSTLQLTGRFWFNCVLLPEEVRASIPPISSDFPPDRKRRRRKK